VYNDFDEGAEKTFVDAQTNEAGEQRLWRASYPRPLFAGLGNLAMYGIDGAEVEFGKQGQMKLDAKVEQQLHESMQKDHLPTVLKVLNDARKIVESKFFKTYALDTQDEWYSIVRMAHFGRLAKVPSMLYEQANRDFAALIRLIKGSAKLGHPMSFIMASKTRDEWEGSGDSMKKTGRQQREGNDKVPYLIEEYFRSKVTRTRAADGTVETKFTLELLQSANSPNLVGFVWEDAMIDFKTIASMVKPDVDPAAWEDAL
jgi:hypothetical protein